MPINGTSCFSLSNSTAPFASSTRSYSGSVRSAAHTAGAKSSIARNRGRLTDHLRLRRAQYADRHVLGAEHLGRHGFDLLGCRSAQPLRDGKEIFVVAGKYFKIAERRRLAVYRLQPAPECRQSQVARLGLVRQK